MKDLQKKLAGELHYDSLMRTLYATDASVYKMLPKAVALPKTVEDIKILIEIHILLLNLLSAWNLRALSTGEV